MSLYILDTGIIVGYIRAAGYAKYIEAEYSVSEPPNISVISAVTVGEMLSLAIQFKWGSRRRQNMSDLLGSFAWIDINDKSILDRYAEIDAFSQGKHPSIQLPKGMTARNTNKNDIWIAATGSVLNATLLTIDKDFDHLDGPFLKVTYIDQKLTQENANG